MRDRPWYKRYPAEFLNGVSGLGPGEIGCYAVVLDMIYDRGGPIPNDSRFIGGRLGCSSRMAKSLIDTLIGCGKLIESPSGLTNIRAEIELHLQELNRYKSVENGAKGGRNRAINAGETLHYNELAQARLKHRARTRDYIERKRKEEDGSPMKEASKEEVVIVSPTLAARFTNRKTG